MMLSRPSRVRLSAIARFVIISCVLLSMLLTAVPAFAAGGLTGNVSGTIADQAGHPVAGANVTVASPSGSYKQSTDARGNFSFLNVQVDTYIVSVEAKGFEAISQSGITVTGDATLALGILKLTLSSGSPRVIGVVKAHSSSSVFQPSQTVPQYTVSGSTLQAAQGKSASASETDVLLAAPGFQLDKTGNLILDGSTTDQVHFFFDGVDFTDPAFNGNGNNYFFNGISSTQIVPGAGDPSQGNSGAGSVNLVVKRGTYPGTGLVDGEVLSRPFQHQVNFQYGIATKNNAVSDYFSYFKLDSANQYGAFGSPVFSNNVPYYSQAYSQESDFVNNFVVRFGKNQNQSLQALYYSNAASLYDDVAGYPYLYDNLYAPTIGNVQALTASNITGAEIPANIIAQLIAPQRGEVAGSEPEVCCLNSTQYATQPDSIRQTTLLKFEYDNQINATTALALRYFNSNIYAASGEVGIEGNYPNPYPLAGQTSGGSRTGGILELTKEADTHNLLTLSLDAELARPNFGSLYSPLGLESLGANAALFVRPANPNEPVSAANPCPISTTDYPGACFLQQYYYKSGGTPYAPPLDLSSQNLQRFYGLGFRDQVQVNQRLRLDLGVRYDLINEGFGPNLYYQDEDIRPVPGSPSTYYVADYGNVENPHFIEPRLGLSYKITTNDSMAFTYGKSINETGSGEQASSNSFNAYAKFSNIPITPALTNVYQASTGTFGPTVTPLSCYPTIPFPVGSTSATSPSYTGSVGKNLQLGKPCASLAQLLYFQGDAYYPEVAGVVPAVFENYDFNYSHQFKNGSAIRIAPFFRQGKDIQVATAPLIYNPSTGVYSFGSLVNQPGGKQTTTGVDLAYTLPDRPYGFTGFINATYINEFTNTPPAGDNPYAQDNEPYVLPQSYATGDLYRAGFVSPVTANLGIAYKTKTGFRVNPVVHFNIGFPYNSGLLTPFFSPSAGPQNVPNTNLTDQFGPAGAPEYIDPANPGSNTNPILSATRGLKESVSGGGLLSRPQLTADMTFEYTPPHTRATFGLQILDIFNNEYFGTPSVNGNYYPVTTGVEAPLTGQSTTGVAYPGLASVVAKNTLPYSPYVINSGLAAPTNFLLYFQYAL